MTKSQIGAGIPPDGAPSMPNSLREQRPSNQSLTDEQLIAIADQFDSTGAAGAIHRYHLRRRDMLALLRNLAATVEGMVRDGASNEPPAVPLGAIELLHKVIKEGGGAEEWPEIADYLARASQPPRAEQVESMIRRIEQCELQPDDGPLLIAMLRAPSPPGDAEIKDWKFVAQTLEECQNRLQAKDGGARHSWMDPALDIARGRAGAVPTKSGDTRAKEQRRYRCMGCGKDVAECTCTASETFAVHSKEQK